MKEAIVYTFTEVFSSTEDFKHLTPYISAILEAEGKRFPAFIQGAKAEDLSIGMTVRFQSISDSNIPIYTVN